MLALEPNWIAPVLTVGVFVVTTAVGFFLMRVAFNMRPAFGPRRRLGGPPEGDADTAAGSPPPGEAGKL